MNKGLFPAYIEANAVATVVESLALSRSGVGFSLRLGDQGFLCPLGRGDDYGWAGRLQYVPVYLT